MEKIIIKSLTEDVVEFLQMEDSIYKNIIYDRNFLSRQFIEVDLLKADNGCIHYCMNVSTIKKGKKYYKKVKQRKGFTLDEKGKLQIWFGSDLAANPHFVYALEALKIDWFVNEQKILWPFMTKTLFQKVLTGKITNPIDYLSAYLKLSKIQASPKLLYNALKSEIIPNKQSFLSYAHVSKDVNHFLERTTEWFDPDTPFKSRSHPFPHMADFMKQARLLEKKIDFKWSTKRMEQEHTAWTSELMEAEIKSIPDKSVDVDQYELIAPYLPESFEPLKTQKRAFMEGRTMKHCVYTNYWTQIRSGSYLAFHVKWKDQDATLGLFIEEGKEGHRLRLNQLYGRLNSSVSNQLHSHVMNELSNLNDCISRNNIKFKGVNKNYSDEVMLPF